MSALLEVRGASKRYGAVLALDDVSITLNEGEVLALLGDNGAGKSTLVKAISGVHRLDAGAILLADRPLQARSPTDARAAGIETVHQDLALFDNLSVAANLYAGREPVRPAWLGSLGFLAERRMTLELERLLTSLRVGIPSLATPVGLLSGGQRQAVAIARAAAFASRVVILDEPTAALGVREARGVLDLVRRFPEQGIGVILVSHNLEHVARVADRAVVLRQGRKVGEESPRSHDRIVALIVGAAT